MTEHKHYVTLAELDQKLDKLEQRLPSRWEVRFLIVAGLAVAQVLPADEMAQAALSLLK